MTMANTTAMTVRSKEGVPFKVYRKGDEFMSWIEDVSGNPLVEDSKGNLHYATWNKKKKQFRRLGRLSLVTRRRYLGPALDVPSSSDARRISSARRNLMDNMSEVNITVPPTTEIGPIPDAAPGSMPRPLLIIYVTFSDSTGAELPDSYIDDIFFNVSKKGTVAHYYAQQLSGAPDITKVATYRIRLDTPGKSFGNDFAAFRNQVMIPALQKVSEAGFDFMKYAADTPFGRAIDHWKLTPTFIVHAQEASTASGSPSVWGHAYRRGTGVSLNDTKLLNAQVIGAFHGGTTPFTVGIAAHECGHALFDLPDLYDTDTSDGRIQGFGTYSLMASGSWGRSSAGDRDGSCPVNLDAYCIHKIDKSLCKEISHSGTQTITSPFEPHYIRIKGVKSEAFLLQVRCFEGYDEAIPQAMIDSGFPVPQPGVQILYKDPYADAVTGPNNMAAVVMEAHGGEQHLRVVDGGNTGDPKDFFGGEKTAFGDSVADPSMPLKVKPGKKPGFDITDIAVLDGCKAKYNISYTEEPGDDDPDQPDPPDPPNPPDQPDPPEPPQPPLVCSCDRPRIWKLLSPQP